MLSVKETDGSYFECFTLLAINRDDRRMSATRSLEKRAETVLENEREGQMDDSIERPDELEQLYVDVLYTVANTVGAPAPGGQVRVCGIAVVLCMSMPSTAWQSGAT